MNNEQKKMFLLGAILICLGIVLGAFGAHALKKMVSIEKIESFEVGVKYQIYHGLAFLCLGIISSFVSFGFKYIRMLMLLGIVLFSGSIYMLVFQEIMKVNFSFLFGPLTPIGGVLLMISWFLFIFKLIKER